MELVKKLANKGYHLYCDNFCCSPKLFQQLYKMGIGGCGTVRLDRRGLPQHFQKTKLQKGDIMTFTDGKVKGLRWMDKGASTLDSLEWASEYAIECALICMVGKRINLLSCFYTSEVSVQKSNDS